MSKQESEQEMGDKPFTFRQAIAMPPELTNEQKEAASAYTRKCIPNVDECENMLKMLGLIETESPWIIQQNRERVQR